MAHVGNAASSALLHRLGRQRVAPSAHGVILDGAKSQMSATRERSVLGRPSRSEGSWRGCG
jgi:hypothetical protein